MYISTLLINVGHNPDRPRPGRLWLRNIYRVHQRLCMAFPSKTRKENDKEFLMPYKPEAFGNGHVHIDRSEKAGFLFRIDPQPGGNVVILVMSAIKPDWEYAFHNAGYLLAAPSQVKDYTPSLDTGQRLRFRLVTNPTKKVDTKSRPDGKRNNGRRVPIPTDQLKDWLIHKAEEGGFMIEDNMLIQSGYIYVNKTGEAGKGQRLRSARYEGSLVITNSDEFNKTLASGIGPGKAFGFGLLSIAPVG